MDNESYPPPPTKRRDHRSPLYKMMGAARSPVGAIAVSFLVLIPALLLVLLVMWFG